jgi:predicted RNA-binding protein YlxR (DUF448 family)
VTRRSDPAERMCLVTRQVRPVDALIRFVLDPDGRVVPDLRRRLPGRGVSVTATAAAVATAERKHLFAKGFRQQVTVEPGLAERVRELLEAALTGALGLARKAGALVTGFGKVEEALLSRRAIALLHDADAAEDGRRKLAQAVRRGGNETLPTVILSSGQLDLALGQPHVIHAAVLAGPAGANVLERCAALARYDTAETPVGAPGDHSCIPIQADSPAE